jgi:hypothetical protein
MNLRGHDKPAGYHPLSTNVCGVSYHTKQISAGYHTPLSKFLRGYQIQENKFQ